MYWKSPVSNSLQSLKKSCYKSYLTKDYAIQYNDLWYEQLLQKY